MCNAYNHPPGCSCGFSGGNHNSSNDDCFVDLPSQFNWIKRCNSLTKPNYKCPICGETVFFYSNEYGSKVYFDFLEKPWLVHPCLQQTEVTTKTIKPNHSVKNQVDKKSTKLIQRNYKHIITNIRQLKNDSKILIFEVKYNTYAHQYFCIKGKHSVQGLLNLRKRIKAQLKGNKTMRFTVEDADVHIIGYPSLRSLKELTKNYEKWDGKLKLNYETNMNQALIKALSNKKSLI